MAGRQRANGEGSIRERYPGCWEGRYTAGYDILTGKRIQKGVFAKTRKECAAKLARAIQQDTGPYYRKGKGYLYFERSTNLTGNTIGRWFVERKVPLRDLL